MSPEGKKVAITEKMVRDESLPRDHRDHNLVKDVPLPAVYRHGEIKVKGQHNGYKLLTTRHEIICCAQCRPHSFTDLFETHPGTTILDGDGYA